MISVPGGQLWADDTGGDRPPLVLAHPGVGDSRIWDRMLPRLAGQFRVIRYDVPGYGYSPPATQPYRPLDNLIRVLDHFDLARVHVVGSSLGGATAVSLALTAPERVAGLVLVCPGLSDYPWPEEPELDAELDRLEQAGDHEGLLAVAAREWAAAGADEEVLAQLRVAALAWPNEAQYQRPDPPAFDHLGDVSTPTVVMIGDLDRAPVIACAEHTAAHVPAGELVWMAGVDHLPPLRVPDLITDTVVAHFRHVA